MKTEQVLKHRCTAAEPNWSGAKIAHKSLVYQNIFEQLTQQRESVTHKTLVSRLLLCSRT